SFGNEQRVARHARRKAVTRITTHPSRIALFLLMLWATAAAAAGADAYPTRPVRFVTAAAGGGNDFATRIIAQGLTAALGQQVIVDNRGGSHIPQMMVAK